MAKHLIVRVALLSVVATVMSVPATAQIVESVGGRALGMGGAFVAVASDSSATWWNPGALAAGPFVDIALGRASTEAPGGSDWRDRASWFAAATPPFGVAYYRLRITDIPRSATTTGQDGANREDRRAGMPVRSLAASQLGVTLVHTIFPGVHAGTTLKYLRGTLRRSLEEGPVSDVLDRGDGLDGGDAESRFDLDAGVLALAGSLRLGGVIRNLRAPTFGADDGQEPDVRLERQVRVGVAFDPEQATGMPLTIALDADVRAYTAGRDDRRVVAIGAEQWVASKRVAIRGGGRFNTVGARERSATGGLSLLVRSGVFVDGYLVRGGAADERGWGVAARVSF